MSSQLWKGIANGTRPAYWEENGTIHKCSGSEVHPGIFLMWTACERDVPANAAFVTKDGSPDVTCARCKGASQ